MPQDSWTRRLDDRVLGPTGLTIVFWIVCLGFATSALAGIARGSWVALLINGVLCVLAGQAGRTQWRRRKQSK